MDQAQEMDITDLHLLHDLALYNCSTREEYISLIYEYENITRTYTNLQIAREAAQLAAGLQKLGIQKGDRVIVTTLNCPEVVVAYQAISRVGGVIIPAMPLLKAPEIHYIATNSQAKAVIASPILFPLLQEALTDVPSVQHLIGADFGLESLPEVAGTFQVHAYSDVVASGTDFADRYLENLPGVSLTADDPAVIIYTSGTTGRPKGVLLTHRNVVSNATTNSSTLPVDTLITLNLLRRERRIDTAMLAQAIQRDQAAARNVLEKLVETGVIEARGVKKGRVYVLSPQMYRILGRPEGYIRQAGFDDIQQEQMILQYIGVTGKIARSETAELCKINEDQAFRLLRKLIKQGTLRREGEGRATVYMKGNPS